MTYECPVSSCRARQIQANSIAFSKLVCTKRSGGHYVRAMSELSVSTRAASHALRNRPDAAREGTHSASRVSFSPSSRNATLVSSTFWDEIPSKGATSTRSVSFRPAVAAKLREYLRVEVHPLLVWDVSTPHEARNA
jgi:hypothetical protein